MRTRHASGWVVAIAMVCAIVVDPDTVAGQQRRPTAPPPQPQLTVRGFGDVGLVRFTASDTFDAVLGSSTGGVFGGGGEVVLSQRIFVSVRFSRFQKTGERVFALDGEVFPLGIEATTRITPIEVSGGYRFEGRGRRRTAIPYLGGGIGWHRYEETSEFADSSENVSETFSGYHVLGGVEFRLARMFGIGGEVQWTTVPDALGGGPGSVAALFDETNLGGIGFRVRFTIGR